MVVLKIGDKVYTPDYGQGVVTELNDSDVRVARIDNNGKQVQRWYSTDVLQVVLSSEAKAAQASTTFAQTHPEFYRCAANIQMLSDYITAQNWLWNVEHLEQAYAAVRSRLAQKPLEPTAVPATAAPVVVAVTPETPAVPALTKEDLRKMTGAELRSAMQDPEKSKQIEALGIPVARGSYFEMTHRAKK